MHRTILVFAMSIFIAMSAYAGWEQENRQEQKQPASNGGEFTSFRSQLFKDTKFIHKKIVNAPFMQGLLQGEIESESYSRYLRQYFFIYHHLERWVRQSLWLDLKDFVRKVAREEALVHDYKFMLAEVPDFIWEGGSVTLFVSEHESEKAVPVVASYLDMIDYPGSGEFRILPEDLHLLAHAYVRYGGDLAGGQWLVEKIKAAGIPDKQLSFYDFGDEVQVKALREQLGALINSLPERYPGCEWVFTQLVIRIYEQNYALMEGLRINNSID